MLTFVDKEKWIRIVRVHSSETGEIKRETVGTISKKDFRITPEIREKLQSEEIGEIEQIVAIYEKADKALFAYHSIGIPTILRQAMDFYETEASEIERRLLASAVAEALRRIRKFERGIVDEQETET